MILFLSNGAGEDAIAARIAGHLYQAGQKDLAAFPLVGAGAAYPDFMTRLGAGAAPPSAGLTNEDWKLFVRDVRAGWLGTLWRNFRTLRGWRGRLTSVVAVGDLVPVLFAGLAGLRPLLFVGTAKSVYHHAYSWPERLVLKRFCEFCMPRDEPTAEHLRAHGVPARSLGNGMLDELNDPAPVEWPAAGSDEPCLALFPGSRESAYAELPRLLRVVEKLGVSALVSLAPSLERERIEKMLQAHPRVGIVQGNLGGLLARCQVALGQAGTANEQAAAAGVPVVAIHHNVSRETLGGAPTRTPDARGLGWYRGRQKGLLGDALEVVPDEESAVRAIARLLEDPVERARRGAIGRERMGPPGGAQRMAEWILARQLER